MGHERPKIIPAVILEKESPRSPNPQSSAKQLNILELTVKATPIRRQTEQNLLKPKNEIQVHDEPAKEEQYNQHDLDRIEEISKNNEIEPWDNSLSSFSDGLEYKIGDELKQPKFKKKNKQKLD